MTSGTTAADLEREEEASSAGLSAKARPKRRRHLARHRLFRKCAVGVLYPVTGVRSRNAPTREPKGIGDQIWIRYVRSALREHAPGGME